MSQGQRRSNHSLNKEQLGPGRGIVAGQLPPVPGPGKLLPDPGEQQR